MGSFGKGFVWVDWTRPAAGRNQLIKVLLKKIVGGEDAQSYDFNMVIHFI